MEKGERLGRKTLSLPLFNADRKLVLMGIRGDVSRPTGRALLNEMAPNQMGHGLGMAHHYHTQAALCLPRQDLEGPNNGISAKERPTGFLSRSDGSGEYRGTGKEERDALCGPRSTPS